MTDGTAPLPVDPSAQSLPPWNRRAAWMLVTVGIAHRLLEARTTFERFIHEEDAGRGRSPRCAPLSPLTAAFLSPDAIDRTIALHLGQPNPALNSSSTRKYLDGCTSMFVEFAMTHPWTILHRAWMSYRLFWLPPAQYGRLFVAPLSPAAPLRAGLSPVEVIRALKRGRLPAKQFAMSGTWPRRRFAPTRFFTLRWLEPFVLLLTMAGVHVLAPIALLPGLGRQGNRSALVLLLLPYVYLAAVSSVGEYGENMRFRIAVEPTVWLITIQSIAIVLRTASAHGRRLRAANLSPRS